MSGPMDPAKLIALRGALAELQAVALADGVCLDVVHDHVNSLLGAHDHHAKRADEAETEASQLTADLAETTSECKRLRTALAALRGELIR